MTKIQLTPDTTLNFLVDYEKQTVEKAETGTKFDNFQQFFFDTKTLNGDWQNPIGITVICQHYIKCYCDEEKCKHKETKQYPCNHLATNIVNELYKGGDDRYGKYWISGTCCIKLSKGYMTPKQFRLFTVGS